MITKQSLGTALARLLIAYVALCAVFYLAGPGILRPLAPVLGRELELFRPEIRVEAVAVARSGVSVSVKSTATARGSFRVTSDASFGFIYPIVVLSLLAAWPFNRWRPRFVALGVAACLLLLFMTIDFPLQIALGIARATEKEAPFAYFFFNNGGRQFLALLIVAVALIAGERAQRTPTCAEAASLAPRRAGQEDHKSSSSGRGTPGRWRAPPRPGRGPRAP